MATSVLVICSAMAGSGWRLLSGPAKGAGGLSEPPCTLVLLALATQVLYARRAEPGVWRHSLWGGRRRRSASDETVCAIKNSRKAPPCGNAVHLREFEFQST